MPNSCLPSSTFSCKQNNVMAARRSSITPAAAGPPWFRIAADHHHLTNDVVEIGDETRDFSGSLGAELAEFGQATGTNLVQRLCVHEFECSFEGDDRTGCRTDCDLLPLEELS